jgi:glycosyltransferase involved in cell wall biosynthesis
MVYRKRVVVVLPAYNAFETLESTFSEIPKDIVDEIVLVDDASSDATIKEANRLGIQHVIKHEENIGYGGNQKSCYNKAKELDADIVVMLHPDYQYPPKLMESMIPLIVDGIFDVVLASRILGNGALKGGMPLYKYIGNRFLTFFQNLLCNQKLSEYHTGYRAFSREVLDNINYTSNSDDFIFDNQMLVQILAKKYRIGEVSCPTKYFEEGSSIGFWGGMKYGAGVAWNSIRYFLHRIGFKWSLLE